MGNRPVAGMREENDLCSGEPLMLSQLALDISADLCMWADQEGRILYANESACHALGYTKNELLSMRVMDINVGYGEEEYARFWNEGKRSGMMKLESVLVRKDGGRFPVQMTINFIKVGEKEYAFNFIRDITELKRAEEALKRSEMFLSNVFGSIQDGISVLDTSLEIIGVNPVMEKWYGTGIVGKKCFEVYHGRQTPCEKCPSIRAIREKTTQSEVIQDVRTWVEVYAFPYINEAGNVTGVIEHVRDVTERKRAEEALKESEANLERAQRIAAMGNWVWNLKTDTLSGSKGYYRIFGVEQGEPVPFEHFARLVHPDDRKWAHEAARNIRVEDRPSSVEFRLLLPGDRIKYIQAIIEVMGDETGRPVKVFGTMQDITERKRIEKELTAARQQAELYLDLMGHDINNMHQIALGYLELARSMPPGVQRDEMIVKPIEVLQRSNQLIRNVQKLQKLNGVVLQTHEMDVAWVLHAVQREFGAVPGKMIALNLNGHKHCHVMANELVLDVFSNLVGNAIKHTGDKADINIDLDIVNDNGGNYCRVSVEDNGPGVPDDFKDVIFNRMLKGATKAKGMGLGLYLVKSLVKSYGGRVWVEDRVPGDHSKGARFVVTLPAVDK